MRPPTRPILALTGLKGTGKTTAAKLIQNFAPRAFTRSLARSLKQATEEILGDLTVYTSKKNQPHPDLPNNMTPRDLLIALGDTLRRVYPSFATDDVTRQQAEWPDKDTVVDDLRTADEAKWVLDHPDSRIILLRKHDDTSTIQDHVNDQTKHDTERLLAAHYAMQNDPSRLHILHVNHEQTRPDPQLIRELIRIYRLTFDRTIP